MPKQLWNALLLVLSVSYLSGCATSPLGRTQFTMLPESQVANMGSQAFDNLKTKMPLEEDQGANAYVVCVAEAVVRDIGGDWEVAVFRENSPNAFALPGGKIGVHSGIFRVAKNQDQLATVIAHEVAHVLSRHTNERLSQEVAVKQGLSLAQAIANPTSVTGKTTMALLGLGAQYGVLLPYNRVQESEADMLGLDLMAKAGFDPRESVTVWLNMERSAGEQPIEFLSTHPSHSTRIQDLRTRMPSALELQRQYLVKGKRPDCDRLR